VNFAGIYGLHFDAASTTNIVVDLNLMTRSSRVSDTRVFGNYSTSGTGLRILNSWTILVENFYVSMSSGVLRSSDPGVAFLTEWGGIAEVMQECDRAL